MESSVLEKVIAFISSYVSEEHVQVPFLLQHSLTETLYRRLICDIRLDKRNVRLRQRCRLRGRDELTFVFEYAFSKVPWSTPKLAALMSAA